MEPRQGDHRSRQPAPAPRLSLVFTSLPAPLTPSY